MRLIVATDQDGGIAKNGSIPWRNPEDMAIFKMLTIGEEVVMGRATFESMGSKPLRNRYNWILTNNEVLLDSTVINNHSNFRYITYNFIRNSCEHDNFDGWIIGGEQIYNLFMADGLISIIYISRMRQSYGCDKFFRLPHNAAFLTSIEYDSFTLEKWKV
jgi:dihydrofolate reductase